jgi:hypothetical protein
MPPIDATDAEKPALCWDCGKAIGAGDAYCRFCGRGQGERVPWQYKHWGVIVITLVGLGPFSLFYLWRSPVISRNTKLVYSALILVGTFYLAEECYKLWNSMQAMLGSVQGLGTL